MICEICGDTYYGESSNVPLCKKHYDDAPTNDSTYLDKIHASQAARAASLAQKRSITDERPK